MKIFITGPSCSGKTTLAKGISKRLETNSYSTDKILIKLDPKTKQKIKISDSEAKKIINEILEKEEWVLEGIQPIIQAVEDADLVVFLLPQVHIVVLRQWLRYITDTKQRRNWGFRNNLNLTKSILKQYFEKPDESRKLDFRYSRVDKLKKILNNYPTKTITIKESLPRNCLLSTVMEKINCLH